MRAAVAVAGLLVLAACSGAVVPEQPRVGEPYRTPPPPHASPSATYTPPGSVPVRQPTPSVPIAAMPAVAPAGATTAAAAGLVAGPPVATLPLSPTGATEALHAFRQSCPALIRRADVTGLTTPADWQPACTAAASTGDGDAVGFFQQWFEADQVGDGRAYATGYFLPEIRAALDRRPGYDVPIYGRPNDLIDVDLGQFSTALKGKSVHGRVDGHALVPYYDRTQIEGGAIDKSAPVIAWGADPVEVFFLQVQGSGTLLLPDGSTTRIGYDSQNGLTYTGIGARMRDEGLIGPDQASMQGIVAWLHAHPAQATQEMRENRSFVFFRPLSGPAVGALGLPVTGGVTAAVDPKFVPLGAPVYLSMDRTDANGIWVAQDTGGAIRGANRFDTFWGSGDEAAAIAGGMSARGTAFLLLPRGTLARAANGGTVAQP